MYTLYCYLYPYNGKEYETHTDVYATFDEAMRAGNAFISNNTDACFEVIDGYCRQLCKCPDDTVANKVIGLTAQDIKDGGAGKKLAAYMLEIIAIEDAMIKDIADSIDPMPDNDYDYICEYVKRDPDFTYLLKTQYGIDMSVTGFTI